MNESTAKSMAKKFNGSVYRNYSGRGMFGAITTGVVLKAYSITPQMRNRYRIDNLGLDFIVY